MSLKEQLRYLQHLVRLYQWRHPTWTALAMFVAAGAVGMCVDFAVLAVLYRGLGLWFGFARIPAFLAAVSVNFLLNNRFTFAPTAANPTQRSLLQRYMRFIGACSAGMAANWLVSTGAYEAVSVLREHYLIAAFLGSVAGTGINFAASRRFVFEDRRAQG